MIDWLKRRKMAISDFIFEMTHPGEYRKSVMFNDIPYGCRRCDHTWPQAFGPEPECPKCGWKSTKCLNCLQEVGYWRGQCKFCKAVGLECWYCAGVFIKFDDNYIYHSDGKPYGLCRESRDWPGAQWREQWERIKQGTHD